MVPFAVKANATRHHGATGTVGGRPLGAGCTETGSIAAFSSILERELQRRRDLSRE
jgi:hypothetical protein